MRQIKELDYYLNLLLDAQLVTDYAVSESNLKRSVRVLTYDSKEAAADTLFVCKGLHFLESYLEQAIQGGVFCYLSEKRFWGAQTTVEADYIIVKDIRQAMAVLGNAFYCEPWKEINIIGITGTKGKSTTAYFVRSILDAYLEAQGKPKSAILSSIENYDGVIKEESHLTTPESMMLQRHFRNAVDSGIDYMSMEVSSQALKYNRVDGITFDVGCFLNIGEDHISAIEHPDFDDYFESKLKLFQKCEVACINLDTDHLSEVLLAAEGCQRLITFGTKEEADVYGYRIVKKDGMTAFMVRTEEFCREFHLEIPGLFNVENALAALAICHAFAIPERYLYEGLRRARVSGRMEVFKNEQRKVTVIVDYAHNRLSFLKLFTSALSEYAGCELVAVFGCPGGKAYARRQELGEIAGRFARKVYITEEDAGEEDLQGICLSVADSVKAENCPFSIIEDREEAIKTAILEAKENTVILLTGKGRETRQKRGTAYVACPSDVDYVLKYL